jgi:exopolysaccharide production protein ExoZ
MATMAGNSRYLSLDHWRGFAALWVLVFHANRGKPPLGIALLDDFIINGWLGVQLFFVISGFCIAERAAREFRAGGTVGRFLLDRLLRIYPPYWAALLVAVALNLAGAFVKGVPWSEPFVLPDGLTGWLMAGFAMEPWFSQASFLLVAWTLTYEIGFYLCTAAGLAVALATRRPWAGPAFWGVLLVIGLVPSLAVWFPLLMLWPHFALGGIVWLAGQPGYSTAGRFAAGTAGIAMVYLATWPQPADTAFPLRFSCGAAWLLLVLRPWDAQLATLPFLRWLGWTGAFSYSLYLVHSPIVGKIGNLLERWPALSHQPLWLLILSAIFTVPCAWLFYHAIELRCENYRRRCINSLK